MSSNTTSRRRSPAGRRRRRDGLSEPATFARLAALREGRYRTSGREISPLLLSGNFGKIWGRPPLAAGKSLQKNVLIYGINYAPEIAGVGRYSGEIGAHFAAEGHDVCVVTA